MSFLATYITEQEDGFMWTRTGLIPFVPVAGMQLDVDKGDYHKVDEVFWKADEPNRLTVWMKAPTNRKLGFMERSGWSYYDGPVDEPPAPRAKGKRQKA